jgi:hypothetical protein
MGCNYGIGLNALRQTTKILSNVNWPPSRVCTVLCSAGASLVSNVAYFALATLHWNMTISGLSNVVTWIIVYDYLEWSTKYWNFISAFEGSRWIWLYIISNTNHIIQCPGRNEALKQSNVTQRIRKGTELYDNPSYLKVLQLWTQHKGLCKGQQCWQTYRYPKFQHTRSPRHRVLLHKPTVVKLFPAFYTTQGFVILFTFPCSEPETYSPHTLPSMSRT